MRMLRSLLVPVVLLVGGALVQAHTAGNSVAGSKAGNGSGNISGYAVSNVHYNLNAANPLNIDSVTFQTFPAVGTGTLRIQLAAAGSWYACTTSAQNVTCITTSPQAVVTGVSQLTVVAAQ